MERYYATGNKRICDQDIQKHQREKRRSNFNHYKNLNLNGPVNFISSGNDRELKNDEDNNELNRNPSPPPPPMFKNNEFEFHQNQPQLKGIGGKLLLQMGYEPGKGLGKNLQGIQVPIKAKPRLGRGAIGAYGPENLNSMPIETVSNPFRRFGETNKKVNPGTTDVLPNNLMFLTHQISSMSTTNENFNSLDIVNNLETGLQQPSTWPSFMNSMRSNLLENFGYDPRNDSKILFKSNYKNISSIYNSRNQNTNRNGKPKIIIPNVSDSLKLAVIDRGDPEGKIRNVNHQKILRELLDSALFQKLDQSPRTVTPLFHWSGFKDDIFKIICQDEQTKIWLIELIQNVGNLWFDADLCLVGLEDFVKFRHSLNKKENFQIHNQKLAKMLKHVSRQFDANWRESERNERKLFEKLNGKLRHRNSQKTIENRNFKSEPDFLLKLESIPELLKIAIIDKNDIEGKIINIGHQNLLEEALYNAILKISEDPDILPRYRWSGFRDNIFKIYCYDEQSKICMEEMVKNVRNLWEGADLVVVGMEEFSHFQQTRKYNFEPENNKFSNEYDDNWKTDEQIQFEDLGQIRNKPSYRNPKDQRKPNVLKSDISSQGFLINIRKITNEKFKYFEFKAIKESLDLLIYETIKTGEFFPQFENVTMNCEDLCIHCANLSTQEWFSKYIIPKFNLYPPWQDAEFKFDIINNEENILEKRIQAKIWFFGLKFKTDDYLKMLQAQNDSLATNLWTVENRKDASDGVHLYVTLDKLSALIINSLNKRPYFGSGRAEVKF